MVKSMVKSESVHTFMTLTGDVSGSYHNAPRAHKLWIYPLPKTNQQVKDTDQVYVILVNRFDLRKGVSLWYILFV